MDDKFLKPYDPKETEGRIYKLWEKSGFFNPDNLPGERKEAFTIILPPPNVTGILHLGHAFEDSLQDAFIRYNRMQGKKALWLPGTDHAAIATESKVEKLLLKKEKLSRHDLGREKFLDRVNKFAQDSHDTIVTQVKRMGASLDWSREAYTLDEKRNYAVKTAFKQMYDDGLIYRGDRIVNWDPKGQTVISDDEVVRVEETTKFYYLKYGPFTIGTARPETKFGDKYVVMHPEDKRYKKYKYGEKIDLEWINGPITATIIKDEAIDMEFGTGVMTITPWHSLADFDIAEKHGLDKEQIIDKYGKLLPIAGEFAGEKITNAREEIVKKLEGKGLVDKVDDKYVHQKATAERTGGLIEPQIMRQWFVNVNKEFPYPHSTLEGIAKNETVTLKKLMRHVVESDQVDVIPARFEKVYYHWIDNLRDWNISRQIWFGHRIPAWYKDEEIYVGIEKPDGSGWEQDPDTLDTWFSSALWTFSTLGWPENTEDLKTYHPTNLMDPAYEILFFWIARMILMSTYLVGQIPFETAYIHGILRDKKGRKFSKSLGNGIDPMDIIDLYGADALRMALIVGVGPGNDSKFDENKVRGYKKFSNKIWNVARFILTNTKDFTFSKSPKLLPEDIKRIEELNQMVEDVTQDMDNYRLYLASDKLYHYVWHTLADEILEESKEALNGSDEPAKASKQALLLEVLATSLQLLHPFMPFITEEIWSHLPPEIKDTDILMVSRWPTSS